MEGGVEQNGGRMMIFSSFLIFPVEVNFFAFSSRRFFMAMMDDDDDFDFNDAELAQLSFLDGMDTGEQSRH